jgi:Tfp pilus assembly ATPase PilU
MADGDLYGMQTFDQSLVQLYGAGLVTRADVLAHAEEPSEARFELDRADFERGEQIVQEPPPPLEPPPPAAPHEPGEPLAQRLAG